MVSDIQTKFFDMPGHKEMEVFGKKKVYRKRHRNDKDDSMYLFIFPDFNGNASTISH